MADDGIPFVIFVFCGKLFAGTAYLGDGALGLRERNAGGHADFRRDDFGFDLRKELEWDVSEENEADGGRQEAEEGGEHDVAPLEELTECGAVVGFDEVFQAIAEHPLESGKPAQGFSSRGGIGLRSARWAGRTNFDWSSENARTGMTTSGMFLQIFPLTPETPKHGREGDHGGDDSEDDDDADLVGATGRG